MATTITAPSQSTAPRWLFAAFAALAAVALVVALSVSLDSESNSPATGVTPSAAQVVGSADSLDHAELERSGGLGRLGRLDRPRRLVRASDPRRGSPQRRERAVGRVGPEPGPVPGLLGDRVQGTWSFALPCTGRGDDRCREGLAP